MSRQGFDPNRFDHQKRNRPVVPQILAGDTPDLAKGFTEIKVVGIGGGGNNTVDRMIESGVQGIDFIAINTDAQALERSTARKRLQIGDRANRGLGTGGDMKAGEKAADSARESIREAIDGADMVFVTAGLGGGTGSGAAPIVAEIARQTGALTVGIVTLPFSFEGQRRRRTALEGLDRLQSALDSDIVISNDKLLQVVSSNSGIAESFRMADETLNQGIHGGRRSHPYSRAHQSRFRRCQRGDATFGSGADGDGYRRW